LMNMNHNCDGAADSRPNDALWKLPSHFVPVSLPSYKQAT
jgi:hypothetical protein